MNRCPARFRGGEGPRGGALRQGSRLERGGRFGPAPGLLLDRQGAHRGAREGVDGADGELRFP